MEEKSLPVVWMAPGSQEIGNSNYTPLGGSSQEVVVVVVEQASCCAGFLVRYLGGDDDAYFFDVFFCADFVELVNSFSS